MAPPLLPAPKVKSSDRNAKKDNVSSSDGFKMPIMPMSAVLSGKFCSKNIYIYIYIC